MTNAEAIKIINCYDIGFYDLSGEKIPADKLAEAFDMAIDALQRTPNAYPTHECVKPTHECVDLISREDALDILDDFQKDIENGVDNYAEYRDRLLSLPKHVGNSDTLKGKWNVYEVANTEEEQPIVWECSKCGELVEAQYSFCPNCRADMEERSNE